jgi:hypothetical protein
MNYFPACNSRHTNTSLSCIIIIVTLLLLLLLLASTWSMSVSFHVFYHVYFTCSVLFTFFSILHFPPLYCKHINLQRPCGGQNLFKCLRDQSRIRMFVEWNIWRNCTESSSYTMDSLKILRKSVFFGNSLCLHTSRLPSNPELFIGITHFVLTFAEWDHLLSSRQTLT